MEDNKKEIETKEDIEKNLLNEIEHLRAVINQMGVKLESYQEIINLIIRILKEK